MKRFFCISLVLSIIVNPSPSQSISELEEGIQDYQQAISLYQHKIDSLEIMIARLKVEENRELILQGVPFVAEQSIDIYNSETTYFASNIGYIPSGDSATILSQVGLTVYKVHYKDLIGYASNYYLKETITEEERNSLYSVYQENLMLRRKEADEERALKRAESEAETERMLEENARIAKEAIAKRKQELENAKAQRKKALITKYGQTVGMRILKREIWLGMTDAMARDSWGSPSDINRSVGSWGVHEQWVYNRYDAYLYFENGKLNSWQD